MSRLSRYTQLIFGSSATTNQMAKFGSFAAAAPALYNGSTITPTLVQALSNYLTGWFGAVEGNNSPTIEDMNAICYLFAFQLAYVMQTGIPEYDAGTTYYSGCLCSSAGAIYVSLTNSNTGNAVTNQTNWKVYQGGIRTVTANDTATASDDLIRCDATAGSFTETLPPVATTPLGKRLTMKCINTNGNDVMVQANAAELIDGSNTINLFSNSNSSVTLLCNGTSWDII